MAEHMRAFVSALNPCALERAPHHAFDRAAVDRSERRIFGEEQRTRRKRGPGALDIGDQRIADLGTVRNFVLGAIMTPMEGGYGNRQERTGRAFGGA